MKQTNSAIKFLMAQYRAIFNNAYFKGLATAAVATLALAAGQAQAAKTDFASGADYVADNITQVVDKKKVETTSNEDTLTINKGQKFVNGIEVKQGHKLTMSGSVVSVDNVNVTSGSLVIGNATGDASSLILASKIVESKKKVYDKDLTATGATIEVANANVGMADFDIKNSTLNLSTTAGAVSSLTAYGEGTKQNDAKAEGLQFNATGKLTNVKTTINGATNITVIGKLTVAGDDKTKSEITLKGIDGSSGKNYKDKLAYVGAGRQIDISKTTINVSGGVASSSGTAISAPVLNINDSEIKIDGTTSDILTLGSLYDRNKAGGETINASHVDNKGKVNIANSKITLATATNAVLNFGAEGSKTVVTFSGTNEIDNKGIVNFFSPETNMSAADLNALVKAGKVDFKSNGSKLNVSGDLDLNANEIIASGDGTLTSTKFAATGLTLNGDKVTLGTKYAAEKLDIEAKDLVVGKGFTQNKQTLTATNSLTGTDSLTINASGAAANFNLKDGGSVSGITAVTVKGDSQNGTLNVTGAWTGLDKASLTLAASGAANLTDASLTLKDLDVKSGGAFKLDNSSLTVSESVKTAEAADGTNGVNATNNSTLSFAYAKVTTSGDAADSTNIKNFKLDGTSTLVLTGREAGEMAKDKMDALKKAFLGSGGQGLFKIDGATLSAKDSGIKEDGTVDFTTASGNAGYADIYENVTVTGVDTATALTTSNDWGAAQLKEGQTELQIGAAGTVTLNGVDGKLVTKADGKTAASVQVSGAGSTLNVVGTGTIDSIAAGAKDNGKVLVGENATLTITKDIGATGTEVGELNVQNKGALNVANAYVKTLTVDGALKATGDVKVTDTTSTTEITGSLEVLGEGKSFATSGAVSVAGSLKATALKLDSTDKQISVGNDDSTGFLEVGSLNLNGGKLLLDPAWGEKASLAFVDKSDTDTVDVSGSVGVGQNAAFFGGLASDSAAAQSILDRYTNASGSLDKNGVGALFVVNQSYNVASDKAVIVNPTLEGKALEDAVTAAGTSAKNTVTLAKGAALVVTDELTTAIANKTDKAVINFAGSGGKLTIENGAVVVFDSALTADDKVSLVSGGGSPTVTNNGTNNITAANGLLLGAVNGTSVGFTLQEDKVRALSNMSRPVQDLVIDSLKTGSTFDKDADGAQYIISVNGHQDGKTLEATSRLAVYAGAVQGTALAQQAASDAVADRMSRANPNGSLVFANNAQGGGLWLSPIYKSHESDSFDADGVDYGVDGDLTGLVLGADSTTESGVRVGGYFNFGSASFDGQGVGDQVSNDADYFGFGLYAGMTAGQFSLLADAGFTQVSNDIEQNIGYKNFSKATADVDSSAVTLGLRGEYKLNLASVDVTPHLGVRYTRLAIDSYDTKINGYQVASTDFDTMQMFSIPFGVTVSKDIAAGAWAIKPVFDLTLTANAGDTDAKLSTYYTGTRALDLTSEAFDSFTYGATVGIDAKYGENFSIGLNTNYTGSSNADEFGVMGNVRYMF